MKNTWIVEKNGFDTPDIELNGSKFLIGNGYMGYRGTMEEYRAKQLVAVNLAGFFDLADGQTWRESVNAPNPIYTSMSFKDKELNTAQFKPASHKQILDIKNGLHRRKTTFSVNDVNITVRAERFVSMARENIIALKYTVTADKNIELSLKTGIDCDIWNLSGTHLKYLSSTDCGNSFKLMMETVQLKNKLVIYESVAGLTGCINSTENSLIHNAEIKLTANEEYEFTKLGGVFHSEALDSADEIFASAVNLGYDVLKSEHMAAWERIWNNSDIVIEGDEEAQTAIRYSIYHLCSIAPHNNDRCGIPARGLLVRFIRARLSGIPRCLCCRFLVLPMKKLPKIL